MPRYILLVLKSFRHKGLREFWQTGNGASIGADLRKRVVNRLQVLDAATTLNDLPPAFGTHPIGRARYGIDVNGPGRITFEFRTGDAYLVDLEQYH